MKKVTRPRSRCTTCRFVFRAHATRPATNVPRLVVHVSRQMPNHLRSATSLRFHQSIIVHTDSVHFKYNRWPHRTCAIPHIHSKHRIYFVAKSKFTQLKIMSKTLCAFVIVALASSAFGLTCKSPQIESTSFTTQDATIVSQIAFISEFTLKCSNPDGSSLALFAEVEGRLSPVVRLSADRFQVRFLFE